MSGNNKGNAPKGNPFSSKLSPEKPSVKRNDQVNPFKTKSLLEDASEEIKREFFEKTQEFSEKAFKKGNKE